MNGLIFSPPVAFLVILLFLAVLLRVCSLFSYKAIKTGALGAGESYACGEQNYDHAAQPDYSQFFPFAFFFTIAHVATLIIALVPPETFKVSVMAVIYIVAVIAALSIFLRKE